MKKYILVWLILLCGCTITPPKKVVTYVATIDGDTIEMIVDDKVEHVRLLLVDTPESTSPKKAIQPYALEAKAYTQQLLEQAKQVTIMTKDNYSRDKYNRLLAYVFVDDMLLQQCLVEEGYARVAYFQKGDDYLKLLQSAEQKARIKSLRIWSIPGYVESNGFKD